MIFFLVNLLPFPIPQFLEDLLFLIYESKHFNHLIINHETYKRVARRYYIKDICNYLERLKKDNRVDMTSTETN